jgi:HSP20 family molecular chaperone IbpA
MVVAVPDTEAKEVAVQAVKSPLGWISQTGTDRMMAELRELVRRCGAESCEVESQIKLTTCVGIADTGYAVRVEAGVPDLPAEWFSVTSAADHLVIREKPRPGSPSRFTVLRLPVLIAPETTRATLRRGVLRITAFKKRAMSLNAAYPEMPAFAAGVCCCHSASYGNRTVKDDSVVRTMRRAFEEISL